jgi:hypothetical protein
MPFRSPVTISWPGSTFLSVISNVDDADRFLFENWAACDSDHWLAAMDQCANVTIGSATAEDVRIAFIRAASRAGMQVNSEIALI